ncbi:MAG: RecX family transcriptional regulator [Anaerolineae bacterium]|nr:RecX family transcriptional regulator [Anaerolineae bacterium]
MAGTITSLVVQTRNKQRVNVYIDGEFAFGLAMIEALKLHKGQQLSDAEIAKLQSLDEIEVAHETALNFLSYRPRSITEVRRKLEERKFSEKAVDAVIEKLQTVSLLDDEGFARYWVENREQFSPRSVRALRQELRQKGVPDSNIASVVEAVDEVEAAYRAGRQRAGRYAHADCQEFRKKVGNLLLRRGFGYDVVRDAVNRLWAELHEDDES